MSTQWTRISDNLPDNRFTTMLMAMGQFIDHDLAHSPIFHDSGRDIDCCSSGLQSNSSVCANIMIPSSDKFFTGSGRKLCMNFVRFAILYLFSNLTICLSFNCLHCYLLLNIFNSFCNQLNYIF